MRRAGCEVVVVETDNDERDTVAARLADSCGGAFCSSHDDPLVIQGQSSLAHEILDQQPACATIVVPVGGGGLLAGSLLAVQRRTTDATVLGAEPAGAAAMSTSLQRGRATHVPAATACDALRAVTPGRRCFEIARDADACVLTVDDEVIVEVHHRLTQLVGPMERWRQPVRCRPDSAARWSSEGAARRLREACLGATTSGRTGRTERRTRGTRRVVITISST